MKMEIHGCEMKEWISSAKIFGERYRKISGLGTYALVFLILTYPFIPSDLESGGSSLQRIPLFIWLLGCSLTWTGMLIALFFEGLLRYSQYGLTKEHPYLNTAVSLLAIILPVYPFVLNGALQIFPDLFSTTFIEHYQAYGRFYDFIPLILSLSLIAYSKYRSPDYASDKDRPLYLRSFVVEVVNLCLCCVLGLQLFLFIKP